MTQTRSASIATRWLFKALFWLASLLSLAATANGKSPFAGTWEGSVNGKPAVSLVLEESNAKLSGTMVFYFQLRGEDGKWHAKDKHTVPLLAPTVDGNSLSFEVTHHKSHGSNELGPNVRYYMELAGQEQAILRQEKSKANRGSGLPLKRQ